MWILYAILSSFFAALTAIFAKVGVQNIDSNLATAIRTVVILLLAWMVFFATGKVSDLGHLSTKSVVFLILSGLMTGLSWLFYFKALQLGQASKVAPIDKLSVLLTMIMAFVFLHEVPDFKTVSGGILILVGIIVIAL